MASTIYQPWAVTAGEIPTTAYWNLLGSNDASFNTGQGFNDNILITRHYATGSVTKPVLDPPHYCALYFSNQTGWVVSSTEVRIPFSDTDTSRNYGITATTGSTANMTIARDGIYDIKLHVTCIDVNTSSFITWFWIDNRPNGGANQPFRTTDTSIFANPSSVIYSWTLPLKANTILYWEAYSGSGNTRLGTDKSGTGIYSTEQLIAHHSAVVTEIR